MIFKNRKKKQYYKRLIDRIQNSLYDMELRIITLRDIREGIRREHDKVSEVKKEMEQRIESKSADKKQIYEWEKIKKKAESDIDKMQEQMMGKYIESEKIYKGGLDEERKTIEDKMKGAMEFQALVRKLLRQL